MFPLSCCNYDSAGEKDTQLSVDAAEATQNGASDEEESEAGVFWPPEEKQKEKERLQVLVKAFARSAVAGVSCLFLDITNGERVPAKYSMDRVLKSFSVDFDNGIRHSFNMNSVHEIYSFEDILACANTEALANEAVIRVLPAEDKNALILLEYNDPSGSHLNRIFLLDSGGEEFRDRFVTCMKILRLYSITAKHDQ